MHFTNLTQRNCGKVYLYTFYCLEKYSSLNKEKKRVEKISTRCEKVQQIYEELDFLIFFQKILRYKNMSLIKKKRREREREQSYFNMTDDASLLPLLRALKKFNETY